MSNAARRTDTARARAPPLRLRSLDDAVRARCANPTNRSSSASVVAADVWCTAAIPSSRAGSRLNARSSTNTHSAGRQADALARRARTSRGSGLRMPSSPEMTMPSNSSASSVARRSGACPRSSRPGRCGTPRVVQRAHAVDHRRVGRGAGEQAVDEAVVPASGRARCDSRGSKSASSMRPHSKSISSARALAVVAEQRRPRGPGRGPPRRRRRRRSRTGRRQDAAPVEQDGALLSRHGPAPPRAGRAR